MKLVLCLFPFLWLNWSLSELSDLEKGNERFEKSIYGDYTFDFHFPDTLHSSSLTWSFLVLHKLSAQFLVMIPLKSVNPVIHCVQSVKIRSFFWSVFSCIQSKYRKIRMRKISVFGHFSHSMSSKIFIVGLTIWGLYALKSSPMPGQCFHFIPSENTRISKVFLVFSGYMKWEYWQELG